MRLGRYESFFLGDPAQVNISGAVLVLSSAVITAATAVKIILAFPDFYRLPFFLMYSNFAER